MKTPIITALTGALALSTLPALAGEAEIIDARAVEIGGKWTFSVTLAHGDTGWDHYADAWRVLDENGRELGVRELAHDHATEQPFTRTLDGVRIDDDVDAVVIEGRDQRNGWGGATVRVELIRP